MKPTQEQVIAWAREAGFEDYRWTSLSGNSELDRTLQVGEYPVGESVFALAILAYEAGRKDENAEVTQELLKMAETDNLTNYFKVAAVRVQARREQ